MLDGLPATPLDGTGPVGPWDGPAPAAFARRVRTAVAKVRTDVEEHVRRDVRERTGIRTWTHPENPALSTMTVTGPTEQVQTIATTLDAGARALTREELGGRTRGMAALDLLEDAVCGDGSTRQGCAQRELGLVMTADAFFDDGPAEDAAGEVRGNGVPVPVTAARRPRRGRAGDAPRREHLRPAHRPRRPPQPVAPGRPSARDRLDQRGSRRCRAARDRQEPRTAPRDLGLRTQRRDRRHRRRPRPRLHLPRLRRPRLALRPRPHHPPPPRTHLGPEPVAQIAPVPSLQDRRPLALPHAHIQWRNGDRARVDQPLGTRQVVEVEPLPC